MDRKELIEFLEVLIWSYKFANDPENVCSKEIRMWRKRFAEAQKFDKIETCAFLFLPSSAFENKAPEDIIKKTNET